LFPFTSVNQRFPSVPKAIPKALRRRLGLDTG
jgi:hypothetical protein